jgi:hypothetical protein
MGAGGLEPPKPEGGGFTVPCNCRYATPPKNGKDKDSNKISLLLSTRLRKGLLAKGIEPSTIRLQVGRSTN